MKEIEKKLTDLCNALSSYGLVLTNGNRDGRIDSIADEDIFIEAIHNILPPEEYEDVVARFMCDQKILGYPVNIKVTTGKSADNVSSNAGVYYFLTGETTNRVAWDEKTVNRILSIDDENVGDDCDYYFLIVNKNDPTDVFWTSLRYIKKGRANGHNTPFQCNWLKENRERVERTPKEARQYVFDLLLKSLELAAKPYNAMKKLRERYGC